MKGKRIKDMTLNEKIKHYAKKFDVNFEAARKLYTKRLMLSNMCREKPANEELRKQYETINRHYQNRYADYLRFKKGLLELIAQLE